MTTITAPRGIIAEAHELRRRYPTLGAATRLQWARANAERAKLWGDLEFDSHNTARIERDGFVIHVQYSYDEYPDVSWIGKFSDTWEPGAIKHLPGWCGNNYDRPNPGTYGWFIPANGAEEARRWYARAGYARHDAWLTAQRQVRSDYERMDQITFYDLKVTVFRAGVELAVDYLSGIDLGDDLSNVDTEEQAIIVAIDPIETALDAAKEHMQTLAIEFAKIAKID